MISIATIAAIQTYVSGHVTDAAGNQIPRVTIELVNLNNGQGDGDPYTLPTPAYDAWTEGDPKQIGLRFKAPGYDTLLISLDQLRYNDAIVLKKSRFPLWMIVLVVAAVAIYRKKSKKVGAMSTGDLMPIFLLVGGVLAFDTIRRILEGIGLWDSADTKNLDNASTNPASFWNPNYWKQFGTYSYAITEATAGQWAKEIYDAMGMFNDDEEAAIAVFKRCRTKANCSYLVDVFNRRYGKDLLAWLRGGTWPQDRLSDADVNTINNYISKLPNS